jgi:PAS domain S-box-containing protein
MNENSSYLENILMEIKAGISILDINLNILKVSEWMKDIYSLSSSSIGKKCFDVYHKRSKPCERCPTITCIETKKKSTEILPIEYKDGSSGWIELTSIPQINKKGEVYQIIEYIKDITDVFNTSKKLKDTKNTLEMVIESSKTGVFDWNLEINKVTVNQEVLNQVKFNEDEVGIDLWLSLIHPDDKTRVADSMERITSGISDYFEEIFRLKDKDGIYKWIISTGKTFEKLSNGNPKRIIGTQRDISEFIEAKELMEESEQKYHSLVQNAPIGIGIQLGNEFIFMNDWGLKILEIQDSTNKDKDILKKPDIISLNEDHSR